MTPERVCAKKHDIEEDFRTQMARSSVACEYPLDGSRIKGITGAQRDKGTPIWKGATNTDILVRRQH